MTLRNSNPRGRSGAAAVELAVCLPLLLLVVLGCVDFGRGLYHYIALQNAAQAGALHASMNSYVGATKAAWDDAVLMAARDEMEQQTGYVRDQLTLQTPVVTVDDLGQRRVRVVAEYPFRTLVDWPGIPHDVVLRAGVEIRVIR